MEVITDKTKKVVEVNIGKGVRIHDNVDLYKCEIGDETVIHPFVVIEGGVKIGKRCKIQAGTFICEGITIEDDVFVGAHVCFTNDKYPRATNPDGTVKTGKDWNLSPTLVKKGASIGSGAKISCGITIGEYSVVGLGAVVTRDVPPFTTVLGVPAKPVGDVFDKNKILQHKKAEV